MPMMKEGIIYLATAPSGRQYVGQTTYPLAVRIRGHKQDKRPSPFARAIRKHGDDIKFAVIAKVKVECLNEFERFYIAELNTTAPNGYNLRAGGNNAPHHPRTRAKQSAAAKGRKLSAETRAKISAANKGRKMPREAVEKKAAKQRGKKATPEHRAKISRALVGRKRPPAHRAQMRAGWARKRQRKTGMLL